MVKYSNILDVSFMAFRFIRQRPTDNKRIANKIGLFWLLSAFVFCGLTLTNLFYVEGNVDLIARTMEGMTTFLQMFIKSTPLVIYRDRFLKLYEKLKSFWDPDSCPAKLRKEIETIYKAYYYVSIIFRLAVYSTMTLFFIQPFFKEDELMLLCYVPDFPYAYQIILGTQYPYAFVFACYVVGFETMYVAYCAHLIVQLKIVNYSIENLDINDSYYLRKFKACVEHHKFLLNFTTEMVNLITIPLLGQYVLSIYLSCMELYLFAESLGSPERFVLSVFYVFCLYIQFALYCFPATEFTAEADRLYNAAYSSCWYEGPLGLQKNIGFVIMRGQKPFKFMAAGLAEINVDAYAVVFKASLSFYTMMQQMKEKRDT